ncbi:hypothetical protein BJ170DRAFT_460572 [Xylariales sp. AK1849]|nr:hypothetical protein BJ170DRAFT_460572 [Xylariales sp. AK1849]
MASELPTGVLSSLASSVKNIVTGHPGDVDTTHTEITKTVVEASAVKKADETVEAHYDDITTVHKEKAAAVVHEDVKRHEHEQVDTVVDKEVHQDHYHTTVLPVKDKKVLSAKHVYQENEAEKKIDHRDNTARKKAKQEAATIHDTKKVEGTTHSKEYLPTKEDEHIHHHIHETIQPVIERETIQEKIIHTTNHIHETEHLNDEYHGVTVAPAISMADFEAGTGVQTRAAKLALKEDKPTTQSASVTKKLSMSDYRKGRTGATTESKKRDAPADDMDIDEATKVGKLRRRRGYQFSQTMSVAMRVRIILTPSYSEKAESVRLYST